MRFIDYFRGERLTLLSDLPPDHVARRLDAEVEPKWMPFTTGVVGWVAFGRFALRYYRSAWFRREYLPLLVGRIRAHGAGSRITLHYRAPRLYLFFFAFWAGLLLLLVLKLAEFATMLGLLLFIGAAMALMVAISLATMGDEADEDLAEMLAVIEAAAERRD